MAKATVKRSTAKPAKPGIDPVVLQRFAGADAESRVTTPTVRNVRSGSVDVDARTLTAVAVTGTPRTIGIYSPDLDAYLEVEEQIVVDGMDVSRVESGMQFLDNHNSWERGAILGVVTEARVEDIPDVGQGVVVDVLISSRPDLDSVVQDLADGILGCISCQYTVDEFTIEIRGEGQLPLMTVTKSTLLEVSLVSVPADPNSLVRSKGTSTMPKTTVSRTAVLKRDALPTTPEELQALIDAAVAKAVADAIAAEDTGEGDATARAELTPEEQKAADDKAAADKKAADEEAAANPVRSMIRSEIAAALAKPAADTKAAEQLNQLRSMADKYGVRSQLDDMAALGTPFAELRSFVVNSTASRSGGGQTHDGRNASRSNQGELSWDNSFRGKRAAERATKR